MAPIVITIPGFPSFNRYISPEIYNEIVATGPLQSNYQWPSYRGGGGRLVEHTLHVFAVHVSPYLYVFPPVLLYMWCYVAILVLHYLVCYAYRLLYLCCTTCIAYTCVLSVLQYLCCTIFVAIYLHALIVLYLYCIYLCCNIRFALTMLQYLCCYAYVYIPVL